MNILFKRFLCALLACTFVFCLAFSGVGYVYADETDSPKEEQTESVEEEEKPKDAYGTEKKGIHTTKTSNYSAIPATETFVNGSFTEGFRYWARTGDGYPSDLAEIVETGENKYLKLNLRTNEEVITTTKFRVFNANVYSGRNLVVIYDWVGDRNFDVELTQWDSTGSLLVSSGFGKAVYEAKNENEWNTAATAPLNALYHSEEGFYFTVKIKLLDSLPTESKIDNIRVALVNSNGVLYDLEGNEIKGVARKAGAAEVETAIVTKTETVKTGTVTIENSVVDTKTIIILCSVCGGALCVIAVAVVLMLYSAKSAETAKAVKAAKTEEEKCDVEEDKE